MAGFVERISVIIDTKVDGALSGIKGFRSAVAEADGFANKFKAGWKNASAQVSANAGMLAATAGTALVAFGVKAVEAFQNTAKAAIDLSKATGLSVEQASRWIAVADDYGVSASTLATALGRIGKNLDGKAMAEYGIATRDAAGNARDANDIFLDVLGVLNNTAPAERAKVGADLLGKGYKELAPIVGKTRAEYEQMLGSVERGQVITEKEAKKAEKMRLAQDALNDAIGEGTLAVGQFVAGLAPMIENVAEGISTVSDLTQEFELLDKAAYGVDMTNPITAVSRLGDAFSNAIPDEDLTHNQIVDMFKSAGTAAEEAVPRLEKWVEANRETGVTLDDLKTAIYGSQEATASFGDALGWVTGPTKDLSDKADTLADNLDDVAGAAKDAADGLWDTESASLDAADAYQAMTEATAESVRLGLDENATQAERDAAYRKVRQSQIRATEAIVKQAEAYAAEKGAIDGSKLSIGLQISELERQRLKYPELTAMIDEYIAKLKSIPSQVYTNVGTSASGGSNTGKKGNWGVVGVEGVDADGGRGQRDSAAPIVVQLMLDGRAIAEITAYQEAQKRGTR